MFDDLAAKRSRLKVIYIVGQPNADWKGRVGRIDEELIREHVPDPDKPLFYVSGPKPMVEAMAKTLIDIGGRPERIKQTSSQATSRDPAVPPRPHWRVAERLWWGTMSKVVDRC